MKPPKKTFAFAVIKLFLFLIFILVIAFVDFRLFSTKFRKLETLENLGSDLNSLRMSISNVGYTMDMIISAERFDSTAMTFIKRDVEKVNKKIDMILNEDRYRWFFLSNSVISEEMSNMSGEWRSIVDDAQKVGPFMKRDEVMLIHNTVDINSVLMNEKFDRLFVFMGRARATVFRKTRILLSVTIGLFVITVLIGMLFYYTTITLPLKMISAAARSYASGNGGVRFKSTHAGIVGEVTGELNGMLDAVKEKENENEEISRAAGEVLANRNSELDTLGRLFSLAARSLSIREIFGEAVKSSLSAGGADAASVYIKDKSGSFDIAVSEGFEDSFLREAGTLPASAFDAMISSTEAVLVKNLDELPFQRYAAALKSCGFSTLLSLKIYTGKRDYVFLHAVFKSLPSIDKTVFFKALASSIETFAGYTARYHSEHELKKFLERVVNQIPYGLAVFNASGSCLLANDMVKKMMGAGPDFDFIRRYKIFDDEILTAQGMVTTIKKSYEGFVTEFIIEYNPSSIKDFRFSGPARRLRIKSTPLYDVGGEITNIALLYEDISSQDETANSGTGKV